MKWIAAINLYLRIARVLNSSSPVPVDNFTIIYLSMFLEKYLPKRFRKNGWKDRRRLELEAKIQAIRDEYAPQLRKEKEEDERSIIEQEIDHRTYPIEKEIEWLDDVDILGKADRLGIEIPKEWVDTDYFPTIIYGNKPKLQKLIIKAKRDNAEWYIKTWTPILAIVISILGLFVSAIISKVSIDQTSKNLEIAQNSLYLSAQPSLDVIFDPNMVTIQNTSPFSLVNVTTEIISYSINNQTDKIMDREDEIGNDMNFKRLIPKEKVQVLNVNQVIKDRLRREMSLANQGMHSEFSIVVIYYREIDQKRFVRIEPFIILGDTIGSLDFEIIPTILCKKCMQWADPYARILIAEEITKMERVFFRVDN